MSDDEITRQPEPRQESMWEYVARMHSEGKTPRVVLAKFEPGMNIKDFASKFAKAICALADSDD